MGYSGKEAKVTKLVIEYLDELIKEGAPLYYEHRSGSGGFNYKKGVPDLFVVIAGVHLEIELKGIDGSRSAMQDKFKWRCETQWHIPYCCPHSFEEFKKFFEEYWG